MEKSTEELIVEFENMITRMKEIGDKAQGFIDAVENNSNIMKAWGGMEYMARRSMLMDKEMPDKMNQLRDDYTEAVEKTMRQVAELIAISHEMVGRFLAIPEEKKQFAAKMN